MSITITELKKIRNDIESIGAADEYISDAYAEVTIDLNFMWYRNYAMSVGVDYTATLFDIDLIDPENQIFNLLCYKTLFLFFRAIAPNVAESDNPFVVQRDYFDNAYEKELQRIIQSGLEYDFNKDGVISADEIPIKKTSYLDLNWRLVRG